MNIVEIDPYKLYVEQTKKITQFSDTVWCASVTLLLRPVHERVRTYVWDVTKSHILTTEDAR